VPCVVLDPFSGSGTTGKVALELGRSYIGIELNEDYAEMSRRRIRDAVGGALPGFGPVEVRTGGAEGQVDE
jgi:adenine specific DNA methylase Mod